MAGLAAALRAAVLQASRRELVTPASGAVVSLEEIKRHVGQRLSDDDVLLETAVAVAQAWVEAYLGRSLLRQTWREWFDGPFPGAVVLLTEQADAVTSLTVYDRLDAPSVVATTVYQVDTIAAPSRLVLREGQTWPADLRQVNAIAVEYTAGWATAADVPDLVKAGIALFAAHRYDHREPVTGGTVTTVPYGIEAVLRPYRLRTGLA